MQSEKESAKRGAFHAARCKIDLLSSNLHLLFLFLLSLFSLCRRHQGPRRKATRGENIIAARAMEYFMPPPDDDHDVAQFEHYQYAAGLLPAPHPHSRNVSICKY